MASRLLWPLAPLANSWIGSWRRWSICTRKTQVEVARKSHWRRRKGRRFALQRSTILLAFGAGVADLRTCEAQCNECRPIRNSFWSIENVSNSVSVTVVIMGVVWVLRHA